METFAQIELLVPLECTLDHWAWHCQTIILHMTHFMVQVTESEGAIRSANSLMDGKQLSLAW